MFANVVLAAIDEIALFVARSDSPDAATLAGTGAIDEVLCACSPALAELPLARVGRGSSFTCEQPQWVGVLIAYIYAEPAGRLNLSVERAAYRLPCASQFVTCDGR